MIFPTAPLGHGATRASALRDKIEAMRKQAQGSKDVGAAGQRQPKLSSARDIITSQTAKPNAPVQGTSVARMRDRGLIGTMPGSNPALGSGLSRPAGTGFAMTPRLPGRKI